MCAPNGRTYSSAASALKCAGFQANELMDGACPQQVKVFFGLFFITSKYLLESRYFEVLESFSHQSGTVWFDSFAILPGMCVICVLIRCGFYDLTRVCRIHCTRIQHEHALSFHLVHGTRIDGCRAVPALCCEKARAVYNLCQ